MSYIICSDSDLTNTFSNIRLSHPTSETSTYWRTQFNVECNNKSAKSPEIVVHVAAPLACIIFVCFIIIIYLLRKLRKMQDVLIKAGIKTYDHVEMNNLPRTDTSFKMSNVLSNSQVVLNYLQDQLTDPNMLTDNPVYQESSIISSCTTGAPTSETPDHSTYAEIPTI